MAADSLPAELWIQVFAATRQWRKVSKFTILPHYSTFVALINTCSKFHDIALPLLYEHAIVRLDIDADPQRQFALSETLQMKPDRCRWIRSLVGYWTMPKEAEDYEEIVPLRKLVCASIGAMIPFLPRLEFIHMDRPFISKDLLTAIYNCPSLRKLSIHDARFQSGLIVPIQNFSTDFEKGSSILHLRVTASSPNLTSSSLFFLRVPNLRKIVYTEYSLSSIPLSPIFFRRLELPWSELRELKLSAMLELAGMGGLDDLCKVLVHAANLESLVVDAIMWRRQQDSLGRSRSPPASTVLPKLKEFYGPALIAPELCKGKAIEKLGLMFHSQVTQVVAEEHEDVSELGCLEGTLRHLILANMEADKVNDLIKAYPLLESLEILPTSLECQRDTVPCESDYIGQPRQEERAQLERWMDEHLVAAVSILPNLTRLVVRPFEGPGAIVARRGPITTEYRTRPSPPDPGPAPEPAEPCIDEKNVLEKSLVPCPSLKDVVFPSLHRWTRYHPTYGWELVERQSGKFDLEDYPLPVSREDLKPW